MRARSLAAFRTGTLAAVLASVLLASVAGVAHAAGAEWGTPTATSHFGAAIEFSQPATLPTDTQRVEVLVTLPGNEGPLVSEVDAQPGTPTSLDFLYDTSGGLYPNTVVEARWRVTRADGSQELGPPVSVRYEDTRYPWKTKKGDLVALHWYDGDDRFAQKALKLAEDGVRKASDLLGVTVTEPFDFYVYADRDGFCAAYGSTGCENVGGFAPLSPDIRTLFALIPPDEIDTPGVGTVIPHELTHLVYDAAVRNPYHYPPRWLNEGFAVYMTEGNAPSYRTDLRQGVDDGTVLPLQAYGNYFPPASLQSRFYLAYAEAVDAVSYIVDTYGMDALVRLIRAYADGVSDDDAMQQAIGKTLAEFDTEWLASIGVKAPEPLGPRVAPPGPVPSAWLSEPSPPVAPGGPQEPSASPDASASSTPVAGAATPGPGRPPAEESGGGPGLALTLFIALAAVGIVLIAVAAIGMRRGRSTPPPAPAAATGWGASWTPPATPPPTQVTPPVWAPPAGSMPPAPLAPSVPPADPLLPPTSLPATPPPPPATMAPRTVWDAEPPAVPEASTLPAPSGPPSSPEPPREVPPPGTAG